MKRLATLHFLLTKIAWGSKGEWVAAFNAIAKGNTKPVAPTLAAIKQYDEQGRTSEYQDILDTHPESAKLKEILFPNKSSSSNFKNDNPEWGEENTDNWGFDEEDTTYGYKYDPKKGWDSLSKQEQRVAYEDFADMFEFDGKIEELNEEQKMRAFKLYKYGDAFFGDPLTEEEMKRHEERELYRQKVSEKIKEIIPIIKNVIHDAKLKVIEITGVPVYNSKGDLNIKNVANLFTSNIPENILEAWGILHNMLFNFNEKHHLSHSYPDKDDDLKLFLREIDLKKYKNITKNSPLYEEYKKVQDNYKIIPIEENIEKLKKAFKTLDIEWPKIFDSKNEFDHKIFFELGL